MEASGGDRHGHGHGHYDHHDYYRPPPDVVISEKIVSSVPANLKQEYFTHIDIVVTVVVGLIIFLLFYFLSSGVIFWVIGMPLTLGAMYFAYSRDYEHAERVTYDRVWRRHDGSTYNNVETSLKFKSKYA
jgi:hypothetical protein